MSAPGPVDAPVDAGLAVLTIVAGRHDHLRGQLDGLRRSGTRPGLHVVVSMGDPAVRSVVADAGFESAGVREGATTTVVVDLDVPADGELPLARARNLAARTAVDRGADLLVLLDVDCIPGNGTLSAYRRAAGDPVVRRAPGPRVLSGAVHYLPEREVPGNPYAYAELPRLAAPHPARPAPPAGTVVAATTAERWLFWSLSFAVDVRDWSALEFCEEYTGYGAEDTDLAAQVVEAGGSMFWVGGADAYHQHHPTRNPPVQHLEAILRNAATFHRRWGWFPMQGWLEEFARRGLATYDAASSTWSAVATSSR